MLKFITHATHNSSGTLNVKIQHNHVSDHFLNKKEFGLVDESLTKEFTLAELHPVLVSNTIFLEN